MASSLLDYHRSRPIMCFPPRHPRPRATPSQRRRARRRNLASTLADGTSDEGHDLHLEQRYNLVFERTTRRIVYFSVIVPINWVLRDLTNQKREDLGVKRTLRFADANNVLHAEDNIVQGRGGLETGPERDHVVPYPPVRIRDGSAALESRQRVLEKLRCGTPELGGAFRADHVARAVDFAVGIHFRLSRFRLGEHFAIPAEIGRAQITPCACILAPDLLIGRCDTSLEGFGCVGEMAQAKLNVS
ncbi:hypothetical protein RRF57_009451 [Xylaria bambusicola]|uniref:Uncharacterized protein n=1 Tax=Xylaria bambusicola TaxID=326684 RepID=A0AAN7Z7V1_9PEZI